MILILLLLSGVIAYFLGGINGAIITSNLLFHKDIRTFGSGNAGLTNYFRTFGTAGVIPMLGIDVLKSILAVSIGGWLLGMQGIPTLGKLFAGIFLIVGHMYPFYYQFKGGKGAMCGLIMTLVVDWRIGLCIILVFALVLTLTRYVSLGSMLGALTCPIMMLILGYGPLECIFGLICALLIIVKHKDNISRLLSGTERKQEFKGKFKRMNG